MATTEDTVSKPIESQDPTAGEEAEGSKSVPTKRKAMKERSYVWDHFTKYTDKGQGMCKCNYCGVSYKCNPRANGTSTYSGHLKKCPKFAANKVKDPGPKQSQINFQPNLKQDGELSLSTWSYNYENCRKALTFMVIVDELPFKFVEAQGFRYFCSHLQGRFVVPSRFTVARDCHAMFVDESLKLKGFLKTNCRRVCLTTDTWTSLQRINYMCLTAHFIDNDWNLNKRILNFCPISSHKGEAIGKVIEKCLLSWGIDSVMTITVDNASSNDVAVNYVKKRVNHWDGSVLKGEFMHVRCVAHIMNLVVNDGLKMVNKSISRVRNSIRYIRSSPARLERFKKCANDEKISSKSMLCLDVATRWNSTYFMLDVALKFAKAFDRYVDEDPHFFVELEDPDGFGKGLGQPRDEDWDNVRDLLKLLHVFYDLTKRVSGSLYVTANCFYDEVTDVDCLLKEWCGSERIDFKMMALKMKEKCDKYWGDPAKLNALLYIAVVLDPRYKWDYLEYGMSQMYDVVTADVICNRVKKALNDLIDEYKCSVSRSQSNALTTNQGDGGTSHVASDSEPSFQGKGILRARFKKLKAQQEDGDVKSELQIYLDEGQEEDESAFDILKWWKNNARRFPLLSLIARDVLAIPVSTVASESAFSTGGRVLDVFRSSLTPRLVEALICTQDWLRASPHAIDYEEPLEEMEKLESSLSKVRVSPTIDA